MTTGTGLGTTPVTKDRIQRGLRECWISDQLDLSFKIIQYPWNSRVTESGRSSGEVHNTDSPRSQLHNPIGSTGEESLCPYNLMKDPVKVCEKYTFQDDTISTVPNSRVHIVEGVLRG